MYKQRPAAGDALLTQLCTSLPTLPQQPHLQYTAAMVVGAYSPWIAQSCEQTGAQGQQMVQQLLHMLTTGSYVSVCVLC